MTIPRASKFGERVVIKALKVTGTDPFEVDTALLYAANDGSAVMRFPVAGGFGGGLRASHLIVIDREGKLNGKNQKLWLFDATLTTPSADNAPFALADADDDKLIALLDIPTTAWLSLGTKSVAVVAIDLDLNILAEQNDLFGQIQFVTATTPAYTAATAVSLKMALAKD